MFKKLSILAILSLLINSCETTSKTDKSQSKPEFEVEEQVVNEDDFVVIENEEQASKLNEETKNIAETVEVQDRVFFGYDSAELSDEARKILDVQARWLNDNPKIEITIEGHCDERGTREYNIALGEKRAISAKKYLEKQGVDSSRIKTISYGKEKPAYFGTSESIHAKNRRSVVIVRN